MGSQQREPVDLIAFFGLSEEEALGLGLDEDAEAESGAEIRAPASALTADAGVGAPRHDSPAATVSLDSRGGARPAPAPVAGVPGDAAHSGALEPDELVVLHPPRPEHYPREPAVLADTLPDHAESLPWPTEAEMLAAGPLPDPEFFVPSTPPGVRPWITVPVVPTPDDGDDHIPTAISWPEGNDPASWPMAPLGGSREDLAAEADDISLAALPIGLDAGGLPLFPADPALGDGRGPYGLTEEQLAELGPDILRDLDLAMAEQLATMPLKMVSETPDVAFDAVEEDMSSGRATPRPYHHMDDARSDTVEEHQGGLSAGIMQDASSDAIGADLAARLRGLDTTAPLDERPVDVSAPLPADEEMAWLMDDGESDRHYDPPVDPVDEASVAAVSAEAPVEIVAEAPTVDDAAHLPVAHAPPDHAVAPEAEERRLEQAPPAEAGGRIAAPTVDTRDADPITEEPRTAPSQAFSGLANQLLAVFMDEAIEMLDSLHSCLELLERAQSETAVIEARRTVHTIKGGARMCGLRALTDLAHVCEDLVGQSSVGQDTLPPALIELLFQAEQEMRSALSKPNIGPGSDDSLHAMATRLREARIQIPPSSARLRVEAADLPGAILADRKAAPKAEDPAGTANTPAPQPVPVRLSARSGLLRRPTITSVSSHGNRLAVDLNKVENMVAKVTEIVANRAASHDLVETLSGTVAEVMRTVHRLQSIAVALQYQIATHGLDLTDERDPDGLALETYGPIRQLMLQLAEAVADQQALVQATMDVVTNKRALAAIETRLDTDLQGALLNMRLLPLSQLRVRLDQVVRSAAATAGREVRWVMEGQNVALDKHVCDRLFEPLMHLLRNAIDHGIEPPEAREVLGKARIGRIVVQAAVEGNQAVVSVTDDGKGMDPDQIAAVALKRGILTAEQAQLLSPREKVELVFRPGFSTSTTVTELSGRGMGMEIVRETCTRMGGSVAISPRVGGGTVITLRVPLSMSIIHALIVRDAGRLLAIPASQVYSVHLVRPAAIVARERGRTLRLGQEEIPLYHLPHGPVRATALNKDFEELSVLVVPYRSERVALLVDEIVSEDDLIVKPLPLLLQGVDRLLGAIVLPNGVPAPVLNLPPLLDQVRAQDLQPSVPPPPLPAEQVVLVVDDSLTMRQALTQSLEHAGYTVVTARDGQEALELIRTRGLPHLVTLDIEMPRMDGLETLYALRQTPGGESLPVFMLTSRSGQKHVRTAMKMGATRYFTKPYRDSEFIGAVHEAISPRLSPTG